MMTSTIRKFGVGVASLALVAGVGAPAMADPGFDPSPFFNVENLRVSGADRVGTAIAYAKSAFATKSSFGGRDGSDEKVAYIAGDNAPADSATAGSLNAPIFLAKADGSSNKDVIEALNFLNVTKVIALGGEKVVPQEMLEAIAKGANNATTGRLGGEDRYQTSVKIAERWSANHSQFTPNKVVLANGVTLVDALTAGTLNWPILLVDEQGKLPQSVIDYLNQVKPLDYIAVGGEKVIPEATVKNAQATSLKSDEISTDDSLPILKEKAALWKTRINGGTYTDTTANVTRTYKGFRVEAKEAEDLAANAMEKKNEAWNKVARAAKKLGDAVSDAYKSDNKLPGNAGDTWAKYVAGKSSFASPTNAVITARDELQNVMREQYNTTDIDLTKPGQVAKYLRVTRDEVTAQETALANDFVNDAVKAANKEANIYYRNNQQTPQRARQALKDNSSLAYLIMAEGSADIKKIFADSKTYYDLGANAFQAAGVAQNAKELTAGNLASAENTLRAINLKIAGVADQLDGKSYWRIDGKDRFATAAGVSARLNNLQYGADPSKDAEKSAPQVEKIYLVNGSAFADATVAGATTAPVLLIDADGVTVPKATHDEIIRAAKDYRDQNRILEIWAVGGRKVVSDAALQATNATAVIAQPNLYKERGEVTKTEETKYKVEDITTYVNNTTGVEKAVTYGSTTVSLTTTPTFTISKGSNTWTATADANNDRPGVTVANGKVKVVTASNTPAGTYTVSFNVNDKNVSFNIKVVSNLYLLTDGTAPSALTLYGTGAPSSSAAEMQKGYLLKDNAGNAANLNDFDIKVTKWTDLAGEEHTDAAENKSVAPKLDVDSSDGKLKFTSQSGIGLQAGGTFEYTLNLKDGVTGKSFVNDATDQKITVEVKPFGADPTALTATSKTTFTITGVNVADLVGSTANSGTLKVLNPKTGLEKSGIQLVGIDNSSDLNVTSTSDLVTGDIVLVAKSTNPEDYVTYKLTVN